MYTVFYRRQLNIKSFSTLSRTEAFEVFNDKKTSLIVQHKVEIQRKGNWGDGLAMLFGQAFDERKLDLPNGNRYVVLWHSFGRRKFITNSKVLALDQFKKKKSDKGAEMMKVIIHKAKVIKRAGVVCNFQRAALGEVFNLTPEELNFEASKNWTVFFKSGLCNRLENKSSLDEALDVFNCKSKAIVVHDKKVVLRKGVWDFDLASLHGQAFEEHCLDLPFVKNKYFVLYYFLGRRSYTFNTIQQADEKYNSILLTLVSKWIVYEGEVIKRGGLMNNKQRAALGEMWNPNQDDEDAYEEEEEVMQMKEEEEYDFKDDSVIKKKEEITDYSCSSEDHLPHHNYSSGIPKSWNCDDIVRNERCYIY